MNHRGKRVVAAVDGRLVVDPETGMPVPEAGIAVDDTPFWRRCIAAGDVVEVKESPKAADATLPEPVAQATRGKAK